MKTCYPILLKFDKDRSFLTTDSRLDSGEIIEFKGSIHVTGYAQILWKIGWHKGYKYRIELIHDNLTLMEKLAEQKGLV